MGRAVARLVRGVVVSCDVSARLSRPALAQRFAGEVLALFVVGQIRRVVSVGPTVMDARSLPSAAARRLCVCLLAVLTLGDACYLSDGFRYQRHLAGVTWGSLPAGAHLELSSCGDVERRCVCRCLETLGAGLLARAAAEADLEWALPVTPMDQTASRALRGAHRQLAFPGGPVSEHDER